MMNEVSKCYDVLGVQPGISPAQLKAAHRDLAKVWHPDRFGHDPRLQAKAQEKLKEINEAYEQISSGKSKQRTSQRDQNSAEQPQNQNHRRQTDQSDGAQNRNNRATRASMRWQFIVGALLVFGVAFLFTTRSLVSSRQGKAQAAGALGQESASKESASEGELRAEAVEKRASEKKSGNEVVKTEISDAGEDRNQPVQPSAVTTETALIDTTTGLLARPDCPLKSRITFVRGNQPTQYCSAAHAQPTPKDSKIKAVTKRLTSPKQWLSGKNSEAQEKRSP